MPMQSITPGDRRRVKVSVWDGMYAEELFIKVRNRVNIADCGQTPDGQDLHKCIKTAIL